MASLPEAKPEMPQDALYFGDFVAEVERVLGLDRRAAAFWIEEGLKAGKIDELPGFRLKIKQDDSSK
jgi:hypothetical protein